MPSRIARSRPLKILYVSPQHVSGTLALWQEEHRRRGNECRYVTLFPSAHGFSEDIALNLPLHPDKSWIAKTRKRIQKLTRGSLADDTPILEIPPYRRYDTIIETLFFRFRDALITPYIRRAIQRHDLDSFDIIHLDQGAGFLRSAAFIRRWKLMGKHVVAFYHGSDMRNRGIFRRIDELCELRLTSEVDLLHLDDRLQYLFLPFDTTRWTPQKDKPADERLRIVHAARVRAFKGTDRIVEVVKKLEKRYPVELVLLENVPHDEAMRIKAGCDIAVDQIADTGGWGYGMSSVEYLSMGIPTCTSMVPEMEAFLPDHPFIAVTSDTLERELEKLILAPELRRKKGKEGRRWVVQHHDVRNVGNRLYELYRSGGLFR